MATKLLQGAPIHKISNNWRMAQILELIRQWLSQYQATSFKHSVREGNKLAEFIANVGAEMEMDIYSGSLFNIATEDQLTEFQNIVENDRPHHHVVYPDADDLSTHA